MQHVQLLRHLRCLDLVVKSKLPLKLKPSHCMLCICAHICSVHFQSSLFMLMPSVCCEEENVRINCQFNDWRVWFLWCSDVFSDFSLRQKTHCLLENMVFIYLGYWNVSVTHMHTHIHTQTWLIHHPCKIFIHSFYPYPRFFPPLSLHLSFSFFSWGGYSFI